jgi:hypothetical protein
VPVPSFCLLLAVNAGGIEAPISFPVCIEIG